MTNYEWPKIIQEWLQDDPKNDLWLLWVNKNDPKITLELPKITQKWHKMGTRVILGTQIDPKMTPE